MMKIASVINTITCNFAFQTITSGL